MRRGTQEELKKHPEKVVSALISAGLAIVAAIVTATALRSADSQGSSVSA